jgi:uncharacterized repeat protein (TIGR03806 family)
MPALGSDETVAADGLPAQPGSVARRPPWNGSKFSGTPDPPPPYTVEPAFPRLKFEFPVVLVPAKGTSRLFVGELKGRILSFPQDPGAPAADLALDLAKTHPDVTALYGLVFHPEFEKNRYVYICYVGKNAEPEGSVVARFAVRRTDPPVIDPASERVLLRFWSGGHNGGCLAFGTDGYLYISTGDGTDPSPPDSKMTGQDCSDLLSSVLRIDVDQVDPSKAYRIPPDNPLLGVPGARPEIWAFGFRNPWKMSVDRATGELWLGDVGWELWEMVHNVKRGGNYGWSVMEGPQPVQFEGRRGPTPILPPVKAHPHSEAASITGGYVYHGTSLPELAGAYIYGDYQTGIIWALRYAAGAVSWHRELARTPLHLVAFGEANDNELYLIDHDRTHQIYRLVTNRDAGAVNTFPRRLSESGILASTRDHRPAPGVVPYSVNASLWSDGATAVRLLAVPGDARIAVDDQGAWRFPDGSVLARTVSVEREPGKPASRVRMETQILHLTAGAWRPYTYVWTDEQSDAILADAAGGIRANGGALAAGRLERGYRVSARAECVLCHNPWVEKKTTIFGTQSASPLGANAPQLNRRHDYGGFTLNQLEAWNQMGLLAWTPDVARLPSLVDPDDESADLDRRARSYLQTNCAHCHQFNAGGTATIALGYDVPLEQTRTVGARPIQGTFNIAAAKIIAPGDPSGSVLYYRMSKLGGGRMPRVGSDQVDEGGTRLIRDWIARMPATKTNPRTEPTAHLSVEERAAFDLLQRRVPPTILARGPAIRCLASSTRGALLLLGLIDRDGAPATVRDEVVTVARTSPQAEIRDLFERFVPERDRVQRLGDVIDRAAVLALSGAAARGRELFLANTAAQCKNCHKAGGAGESVGPDLDRIGSKYDKPALLDQILEPSKKIEPPYVTHLLETKDGRVTSGLLLEKTGQTVVLKDAQGKTIRLGSADVERIVPQSRSLMPDLLLRDLTAQQVADLLEYLMTLK